MKSATFTGLQRLFHLNSYAIQRQCLYTINRSSPKLALYLFHQQSAMLSTNRAKAIPTPSILHSQPPNANWRESTSLIMLAKDSTQQMSSQFDYSALMVKRSGGSSFMPSAFVFPGGRVELSDFDTKWYRLFEKHGIAKEQLDKSIGGDSVLGPRPPIVTNPITARDVQHTGQAMLNPEIALRITAIRETFEEAGVLLLTNIDQRSERNHTAVKLTSTELNEWQLRVRKDGSTFFDLCEAFRMIPNIWSLYEWCDWLTPTNQHNKRYDAIFYVCCLAEKPDVQVDNAEVTKPIWSNPESLLAEPRLSKVFLAPPQIYELSRMLHFPTLDQLHTFAQTRQSHGLERWMPVISVCADGTLFILPGDERYPMEPEMVAKLPVPMLDTNMSEQDSVRCKNLTELRDEHFYAVCSVDPVFRHVRPITYPNDFQAK